MVTLSRSAPEPVPAAAPEPFEDDEHPVAAVLALEAEAAKYAPSLIPNQPDPGKRTNPGHLTPL